jgi:hypothetical protein
VSSLESCFDEDSSPGRTNCIDNNEKINNLKTTVAKKENRKLQFDSLVRVTLIPSIKEYKEAGLHTVLWCSPNELQSYKDSAYLEIKEYMREHRCATFNEAMKLLFASRNFEDASNEQESMKSAVAALVVSAVVRGAILETQQPDCVPPVVREEGNRPFPLVASAAAQGATINVACY